MAALFDALDRAKALGLREPVKNVHPLCEVGLRAGSGRAGRSGLRQR